MIWRCASHEFNTATPVIMGILNVTPDSFSDGGDFVTLEDAVAHAERMVEEGAALIDVGGESTRPGAAEVAPDEELTRVLPVVEALVAREIPVSIDTRHAKVARAAVSAGACVINDVSGFRDEEMRKTAATCDAGVVIMHMQGEPGTMQDNPQYNDVVAEVRDYLVAQAAALEATGVARERICIDPGPGFGKTPSQTVELLRNLQEIVRAGYPVMAAVSRKSFLPYAYGREELADPKKRDHVSATEALMACELGASVVRTHNVAETVAALKDLRPYVLLGLGCNVALTGEDHEQQETKIAQLGHAIGQLCSMPDTQIIDISGYYESEPAYYTEQDPFVNAVVLLRSGIPPKEMLKYLHAIENSLGRVREIENGPRTCDIDILDYQMYVCESDILTLPHPRVCERDFVVKPLLELLPNHVLADGTAVDSVPEGERVGRAVKL